MHCIDPKWTELAVGYQAVRSLNARLDAEFGRAVQAGHEQKFRRELTGWQKKRRVFFVLAVIAPLSIITLCLTAFYFRDVACVIVYWTVLVLLILVTLAVAGRNYIREVMNRPKLENIKTLPVDLEQRWWDSLSPQGQAGEIIDDEDIVHFLALLDQALPGTSLAICTPSPLLLTPAGLWFFKILPWSGTIIRQDGVWKQIQTVRDKLGRKQSQVQTHEHAPDEEWLLHKKELANILNERLPQRAWTGSLIQGGIVFTHPQARLDKPRIQGNLVAYGLSKAWVERIRRAPVADGFTLEIQLEILDSLHEPHNEPTASAKDEAGRLYQAAANELQQSVARMVTATG